MTSLLFLPKLVVSGLICTTTGELALVVLSLALWVGPALERLLSSGRFIQCLGIALILRIPVFVGLSVTIGKLFDTDLHSFSLSPSASWIVVALHIASWWLVPAHCHFTLFSTLHLTEYVCGWFLVVQLSLLRLPYSIVDCLCGLLVGTILCSSYVGIHRLNPLKWVDTKADCLIWSNEQMHRQTSRSPTTAVAGAGLGPAPVAPSVAAVDEGALNALEAMGFGRDSSRNALLRSNNDVSRALEVLLGTA
jgi:hypothetical protein